MSINENEQDQYYNSLFWKNINLNIQSFNNNQNKININTLREPCESNLDWHKSCSRLNNIRIIQYALDSFASCEINEWLFVVTDNPQQKGQFEQISNYINEAQKIHYKSININTISINGDFQLTHSLYQGLKRIYKKNNYNGDVIISYSDIVWEHELLKKLLSEKDGDIIVMVDTEWQDNYPYERRFWHDKLYAELVYLDRENNIERIGEAINRFDMLPKDFNFYREEEFDEILSPCRGEIVGLFKFIPKGAKAFLTEYKRICKEEGTEINIIPWESPSSYENLISINRIHIEKQALLGDYIEYLSKKGINIKLLEIQGSWAEIDHWGDIQLAEKKNLDLTRPTTSNQSKESNLVKDFGRLRHTKSILSADFIDSLSRACVKRIPIIGSFLYDVIYGTIDSQKYRKESKVQNKISKTSKTTNGENIYTEKWYQNRTIQAALIGAATLILVSIISWPISYYINKPKISQGRQEMTPSEVKLPLSLKEICQDIDNRPLLQREQTAKSYVGMPVKRENLILFEISPEEENYLILMVFPGESYRPFLAGWGVSFTIRKDDYPELAGAKKRLSFYVSGQIQDAGSNFIHLSNVSLSFD